MFGRVYKPIHSYVSLFNRTLTTQNVERGSTLATAFVIPSAHHLVAVRAEYALLRSLYPGHVVKLQALISSNGKHYDKLNIVTADGKQRSIYFDITQSFTKLEMNMKPIDKQTTRKTEETN